MRFVMTKGGRQNYLPLPGMGIAMGNSMLSLTNKSFYQSNFANANVRPFRMLALILVVFGLLTFVSSPLHAQEDIFGDESGAGDTPDGEVSEFGDAPTPEPARNQARNSNKDELPPSSHPVVIEYRQNRPKTPEDFARAFLHLSRLQEWKDVAYHLDAFSKLTIDSSTAVRMLKEIGHDQWLSIKWNMDELNEKQQAVVNNILDKATAALRGASLLDIHFAGLQGTDAALAKKGYTGIQSAGTDGLAFLLSKFVQEPNKPSIYSSYTLHSFGEAGYEAVSGAFTSSDPAVRERLVALVAPINGSRYLELLSSVVYSRIDTQGAKKIASDRLAKEWKTVPQIESVQKNIGLRLDRYLKTLGNARRMDVPQAREIWLLQGNKALSVALLDERRLALEHIYQTALQALRLETSQRELIAESIAAVLERSFEETKEIFVESPLAHSNIDLEQIVTGPEDLGRVWRVALQRDLPGAQLRIQQKFFDWPEATVAQQEPLRAGLSSGYPAVRFAASHSLANRMLSSPTPLASKGVEEMVELLSLESEPLTLVLGSNDGLCDHASILLKQAGHRSIVLSSGRAALRYLEDPNPVESILFIDSIADISLPQLVQRIRANPRGSKIPFAILAEDVSKKHQQILSEEIGLIYSYVPSRLDGMIELLRQMDGSSFAPRLTAADRTGWSSVAQQFFQRVVESPMEAWPTDFERWKPAVATRMGGNLLGESSNEALVTLGSRESQRELANRSTQWNLDLASRKSAAQQFIQSSKMHGLKLDELEIQGLYDAYNDRARTDLEVRKYLGEVLDAVDKKLGR